MSDIVDVPFEKLHSNTLTRVIEEFVCREGTDYGHEVFTLEQKVEKVRTLLEKRKAKIVYSMKDDTCTVVMV